MKINWKLSSKNYILYLVIIVVIATIVLYLIPRYVCSLIKQEILESYQEEFGNMTIREGLDNQFDGLKWIVYNGYFNDDVYFPNKYVQKKSGSGAIDLSSLNTMTQNYIQENKDTNCGTTNHMFSIQLLGYFVPNVSGYWQFRTTSDDASYLWIDSDTELTVSNYSISNATVNNRSLHGAQTKYSVSKPFTQGKIYQIRIQMGENCGRYKLTVEFLPPGGSWSSNFTGLLCSKFPILPTPITSKPEPGLNVAIYKPYLGKSGSDNVNISGDINSSLIYIGTTNNLSSISTITNNYYIENRDKHDFTIEITGSFLPNVSGDWSFYTNSDDASYLWIGDYASSGWDRSNAVVKNGNLHAMNRTENTIRLNANTYYPFRVLFGENDGGYNLTVGFKPPGGSWTTNGTGYFFKSVAQNTDEVLTHKYGMITIPK